MATETLTVMIMAAGTGGHVFPALSIAESFKAHSVAVEWLGTPHGMENGLLKNSGIPLHQVTVSGLRGSGAAGLLRAPLMLARAFIESWSVLRRVNPDFVIGLGGFVCGPAGIACKLQGRPLFIHEQNAVAGFTNRILARFATRIFAAFPNTFPDSGTKVLVTGNPLRAAIRSLAGNAANQQPENQPHQTPSDAAVNQQQQPDSLHLLVLGGSHGAQAINRIIPPVLDQLGTRHGFHCWHQTGERDFHESTKHYRSQDLNPAPDWETGSRLRLVPFIQDIAEAFSWADIVVCRSGASTVSEVAAACLPAIFVPYPHHRDQQQTLNARWLADQDAAIIMPQDELNAAKLTAVLEPLLANNQEKQAMAAMGRRARSFAILDADTRIVNACLEVLHEQQ